VFAAVSCVRDIGRDIGGLTDRGVQLTFWACFSSSEKHDFAV